tara:strand:+ start:322 stop:468 length:147 start_codon:yes stop_codon:yes gene_type:complete
MGYKAGPGEVDELTVTKTAGVLTVSGLGTYDMGAGNGAEVILLNWAVL